MNKRIIRVPATLDSSNRKKDRTVKFSLTSMREIPTDEYMLMDSFHQSAGFFIFAENEIGEEEIPEEDVEADVSKSQSVQIRDALWVLFKAKGGDGADKEKWTRFYRKQCQVFKARILDEVHLIEENQ